MASLGYLRMLSRNSVTISCWFAIRAKLGIGESKQNWHLCRPAQLLDGINLAVEKNKTAEDGDCNIGKTIRLITEDKKQTNLKHMWNKVDIRAVPLSCETSTAPFWRTDVHRFVQEETLESTAKIETYRVTKVKIYLIKYWGLWRNGFLASRRCRCPSSFA